MSGAGGLPRISWHRGGAELAPLGSLAAFSAAAASGAELIEVDVRRTVDGTLVCHHDAELAGFGPLARASFDSARSRRGADLFSLSEFLDALEGADPGRNSAVHLDLKESGDESKALDEVLERGRRVLVTSPEETSVSAVRASHPGVPVLLTLGRATASLSIPGQLRLRAREAVPFAAVERTGATGVAAHYLLTTPALRGWCRWRGLQLLVWTVDAERSLSKWVTRRDVDVVTTNRPLAARQARQRSGAS